MIFFYKGYPEKLGGKWGEKIPIIRLIDCAVFASPSKMGKLRRAKAVFALKASDVIFDYAETSRRAK
jgi:hypothetical protein